MVSWTIGLLDYWTVGSTLGKLLGRMLHCYLKFSAYQYYIMIAIDLVRQGKISHHFYVLAILLIF